MPKFSILSGALFAAAMSVAACGGGTPGASGGPTIPPVNVPSVAIPSVAIPSVAIPSIGATLDPVLAARFPTAIEGATLSEVSGGRFIDVVNAFEEPEMTQQFVAAVSAAGMDPNALTYANQIATINETDIVQIQALRTANADANRFVQIFPQVEKIIDPESEPDVLGQATIGGKNVATLTDSDGNVDYLYVTDDVVWRLSGTDEGQAAMIIAALH